MRLIDADVMREDWLNNGLNESIYDTNDILNSIDEQPTVEPVRRGHWIDSGDYVATHFHRNINKDGTRKIAESKGRLPIKMCSNCHMDIVIEDFENYCPNCGAKMK